MSTKRPKSSDDPTRARKRGGQAAPDAATTGRKLDKEISSDAALETSETTRLPWATMSRLTFLEESIFWTDSVNRRDLIARFGISEQQASGDLTRYQEIAPDNLVYDKSDKTYRAGARFAPRFLHPDTDEVLSRLRLTAEGVAEDNPLIGFLSLGIAPAPARPVESETLRVIIRAIREARQLSAHYVSFSQTDGRMRRIEPHALGYDGFRWHARARDAEDGAFKDYVLGRLSSATLHGPAEAPSDNDRDWHGWVTLVIAPNPGLSPAQKKVIERDYGMRGGTADLKVRKALAYYTKHRLGLDLDPKARRPEDQHVISIGER
ncbi:MAG: WYL domain-containing protein [Burkholderiales bacterium]|nr:MAG: WYL domain-containing protein [Burkholderiales bacterium]